jgi:uncharacterized protein
MIRVLNIPGLWNSGPKHWQSHWEAADPTIVRVQQREWERPRREEWVLEIERAVSAAGPGVLLTGHSLGCSAIAFWARETRLQIRGALLVAPSDSEAPGYPKGPIGFSQMPLWKLPFPSITVASTDDPYVSLERARAFAAAWESELVVAGALGHINSDSDLGMWPQGQALLERLKAG